MMKKIFLVFVLVAIAAGGGILGYTVWKKTTQTPQAFLDQGKKYFEDKKYKEALIEFMNAVRVDPRNRDGRLFLARTYLAQQNGRGAVAQLKALLEYYPDDVEGNLELADIYFAAGRGQPELLKQAQEMAQKVLAKEPNNVKALVVSGHASGGLKDYDASVETLERAIALDPANSGALASLGATKLMQKDAGAESDFLKARDANPKDIGTLRSLATYYRATKDTVKAEAALKDALAVDPADRRTYLQALDFYLRANRFDEAEKVLQNAQAKSADDPSPSLVLANIYEATNRGGDERKLLLDLKTKFPKNVNVATTLATNLMRDQPERARAEIDQIMKLEPKNPAGYVLLGELQYRAGQFDSAEATLGKDPALNSPFPQAHDILGHIAAQKGQLDQAIDHFQKSLAVNKSYVTARLALADTFLRKGRPADSREELQKVLAAEPKNASARLLKTTLDITDKKYAEAESGLLELAKEQPDNPIIQRQLGLYYEDRGKNAEAEKSLSRAVELSPDSESNFQTLISFYLKTKQVDRAAQKLNSVPDAQKQAFHYELLGAVAAQAGKPQDAENAYKKAWEKDPSRSSAEQLLFGQYVQNKRFDEALKILDNRLKKNPSDSGTLAMRGTVYEAQGKVQEARQDYERALQANPNQDTAANNLAYMLAEEGHDLDAALKWAQGIRNRHPDSPGIADTLGWVYYKLGRSVLARDSVQFAASKQPDNPLYQYHLGAIYKANNQPAEAETALKKAIASPKDFKEKKEADAALKDLDHWRHLVSSNPAEKTKK